MITCPTLNPEPLTPTPRKNKAIAKASREGEENGSSDEDEETGVLRVGTLTVDTVLSQRVFIKSFCKSQFPHKSVNLSFTITNMMNKLTDFAGIVFCRRTL